MRHSSNIFASRLPSVRNGTKGRNRCEITELLAL
ncbi:hypothetical protein RLEG3_25210 [Rhizobium leguminosarum bv. trifolii WSM1689]|nr:hypothetical protein RLEG3_25210 [Rhizobium leguminosarum bv. trifolii WSM1689]